MQTIFIALTMIQNIEDLVYWTGYELLMGFVAIFAPRSSYLPLIWFF